MATTVSMPQLGETVTEGTILKWAKQVGETIAVDEVLVEISTDKVDTEVPSPAAGTILEILVPEGETVAVGTPLVVIGESGEEPVSAPAAEAPAAEAPAAEPEPAAAAGSPPAAPAPPADQPAPPADQPAPPADQPAPPADQPAPPAAAESALAPAVGNGDGATKVLSPVVRKLVREHGLDISALQGTGAGGRVTRRDVEALIATGSRAAAPTEAAAPPAPEVAAAVPTAPPVAQPGPAAPAAPLPQLEGDDVRDLDRLRARIGENMIRAKQTAAHVWTSVEVDFERVERVRQRHRSAFKEQEGFSLTYLPFIARATIDALNAYPVVNSSFYLEERKAVFHTAINLGIAIDLDQGGLIVASIRDADGLRLVGLARQVRDLALRAREGRLDPGDVTGSTFTITNPGPFGSFMSAPIINVPNVAILSTDTVAKRPVVITTEDGQDTIAIRHVGYLGLSWDHRAFDGSVAVLFLARIKQSLETWDWEQELA